MEESSGTTETMIDELYEFSAPRFFEFMKGESEEDTRNAELWFETALSYAPSPFIFRIKAGNRSFLVEGLCNFSEADQMLKASESSDATTPNSNLEDKRQAELVADKVKEEVKPYEAKVEINQIVTEIANENKDKEKVGTVCAQENGSAPTEKARSDVTGDKEKSKSSVRVETEACTPKPLMNSQRKLVSDKKNQTAKKIASMVWNSSVLKPKNDSAGTPNLALENQAIKRQKLDGGRSRQILNVKPQNLPHKSKLDLTSGSSNLCSSTAKTSNKLERKVYVREPASPFVSLAEMIKKFQSSTRDLSLPHSSVSNMKPTLKLTKPKEPEFETAQRVRSVRVKSTTQLEEEMMAKVPKFKARPWNKIFEAPALPALPSTPKPPEFQEFHFETMARANKNAETSSVASKEVSNQNNQWKPHLTEPKTPVLQTSSTRALSLPHSSVSNMKPTLKLTRPKEPEFETAQRVRSVRVKSTTELEEEMMAKVPKFKARPWNKNFEAPALPALPRSTPKLSEFQEFHFETMARANKDAETSSVASTEVSNQNNQWKPHLTEPKTPVLQTSLRARPPKVKSSIELEQEELEKAPKFKARPLNKKIFESKGVLGIFCNAKKQVTIPQEFYFAINERIPPAAAVVDLFGKLSLKSEPSHDPIPRNTIPNPFHLQTEERGAEKERRRFVMEILEKQFEEESARVPKPNPYPYTTDYPVIPSKPEPKQCTKTEPFQLESLVRHEKEKQREMEERQKMEKEEAERRIFKAQPILKEDPIPVPEKVRKPLTQVQEFNLRVDHRAVDRAEFDQKNKEKEMMLKRYREESEAARMIEEEKALKQLRRTMVPHARPLPKFDHPFCPQKSSKETTKPKSPQLRALQRKERRKMISSLTAATSSPATLMR